jgi:hypothetical protein
MKKLTAKQKKRAAMRRKIKREFRRQFAANRAALARLESLLSEDAGRCFVTEQVRRAVKRGEALLHEINED